MNAGVPVMVRGGKASTASKYRIWGWYDTFEAAAAVVFDLRANDPTIAWAYIPDEYAALARPDGDEG